MQRIYYKDRSFNVEALPSEISLLVELINLCNDREASFEKFSVAIKKDACLTARFLKIANSPIYRQWNDFIDLRRMLIVLGMRNVHKIIITSCLQQFFSEFTKSADNGLHHTWLRSLICAHLAEKFADLTGYAKPEEAYLAGILHQIGILLLLVNYKENYQTVLDRYYDVENFCELERNNYGIDHCEIGSVLIESWNLDSLLADAIHFQRADTNELINSPALLRIVAAARSVTTKIGTEHNAADLSKAALLLGVAEDDIQACLNTALEEGEQLLIELGFSVNFNSATSRLQSEPDTNHTLKDAEFSEQIKNLTLAQCFSRGESKNKAAFIKELRMSFDLLFNLQNLLFISPDKTHQCLTAFNDLETRKLDEIKFNLQDHNSVIIKCFTEKRKLISLEQQCSIIDNQLIRIMGSEAALCLPIYSDNENLGVLVIGIARKEVNYLEEKAALIEMLTHEISSKYLALIETETSQQSISFTDFNKLVHEVKNPLTIINNYLYILGKKLTDDHAAKEEIKFISEEVGRVSKILSKATDPNSFIGEGDSKVNINNLLVELDNFFKNSLYAEKKIQSKLNLETGIPPVPCPKNNLKQIIINIIKNAVEALPEEGLIEIATRDHCFQNGHEYLEISIRDNGPGIDNAILKNLFTPVESTKKGHSGLGLAIVSELIAEMSGNISCYSNRNRGTEFIIHLPHAVADSRNKSHGHF